jgi:H+/Cl- antiporter ClcA
MRLKRRKLILGVVVILVAIGVGYVGASVLIGQAVGREVARQLGDSIAKDLGDSIAKAVWK